MPSFKDKSGNTKFSMNPQVGKTMYGDDSAPGIDQLSQDPSAAETASSDDHVEIHHGGNPQGQPPATEMTKFHTIHAKSDGSAPDIQNHDDYDSADQHMKQCMGESDDMGSMNMSGSDDGQQPSDTTQFA